MAASPSTDRDIRASAVSSEPKHHDSCLSEPHRPHDIPARPSAALPLGTLEGTRHSIWGHFTQQIEPKSTKEKTTETRQESKAGFPQLPTCASGDASISHPGRLHEGPQVPTWDDKYVQKQVNSQRGKAGMMRMDCVSFTGWLVLGGWCPCPTQSPSPVWEVRLSTWRQRAIPGVTSPSLPAISWGPFLLIPISSSHDEVCKSNHDQDTHSRLAQRVLSELV